MSEQILTKSFLKKTTGLVLSFANAAWIYDKLQLFYLYHFTSVLFVVKIPDSVLIFNTMLGICGIIMGIAVFKGHLSPFKGLIIGFAIFIIGTLLMGFSTM